jgi:hypothetical protein
MTKKPIDASPDASGTIAFRFLDLFRRSPTEKPDSAFRNVRPGSSGQASDPLKSSALYRLKRDSLFLVAKMNEGKGTPSLEAFKRQVVFVQSQLVLAAIRDPDLPVETKAALVGFQETSIRETVEDRRGIKRRACLNMSLSAAD